MELRQLRYFVRVAELLSFSEAAKSLCITQSTLSQQIKQLERELDAILFLRNSHDVFLTETGQELLPHALATLHNAETCTERIRDLRELRTGTLNIGVTHTFSPILTETVLAFMRSYPGIKLNISYRSMEQLMEALERHEVDFVLSFKPGIRYPNIESHILFDDHLCAVVNRNHPLARKETVTLSELKDYDLALPARGLQARNTFDALIAHDDRNYRVRIELNEVPVLLNLTRESNLVTVLAGASIRHETGLCAVVLDVPGSEMEGCVHVLKDAYRKNSARMFVRMLRESNAIRRSISQWMDSGN